VLEIFFGHTLVDSYGRDSVETPSSMWERGAERRNGKPLATEQKRNQARRMSMIKV